jgi:hypothetical protein
MWVELARLVMQGIRDAAAANQISPEDQAKITAEMDKVRAATQTAVDEWNAQAPE